MAEYETIEAGPHPDDERIRRIRLDAPDRNNTIDLSMLADLHEAFTAADRDADVRGILLGSTSDPFCAGADVSELRELGFEDGSRWMQLYFDTLDVLRDTGKPVVAAVDGTCVAGGNELTMACDLVVAGESARFGQPEVGVGSSAAGGGVQLLPLLVGEKRAREMLLLGELLSAEEAERIGLINRVVGDDEVEDRAMGLLTRIVDTKSPQAYRAIKGIMKTWTNLGLLAEPMARDMTANVWASEEFDERVSAFLARQEQTPRPFTGTRPDPTAEESEDGEGE
ncbi:MAG: enoyl-CoA hydratase/isomerase family protein [Haloarculaceae archaeon]